MSILERADCPLCRSRDVQPFAVLGPRHLARCRRCRHRFVARCDAAVPASEYAASYYAGEDDPRIEGWAAAHDRVWDTIVDQITALHPGAASLLDVGSGTGGFLTRLRARRPDLELAAIEPSAPARASLARRLPRVAFPAACAEDLHEVAAPCDVVTMLQTLEHVRDPVASCRGALQCLRPGGLLFVTVPNRNSLAARVRGHRAACYANTTHLHFFGSSNLRQVLGTAGFTKVRRLVTFGGGQHRGVVAKVAQFVVRAVELSAELRMIAWRS